MSCGHRFLSRKRDKLLILLALVVFFAALTAVQQLVWPRGRPAQSPFEHIVGLLALTWLQPGWLFLVGLFLFRDRRSADLYGSVQNLVTFRIVSRGQNADVLQHTIRNVREQLAILPVFRYRIEVVTDLPLELEAGPDLTHFVIPPEYRTANGSLYKARALQYALDHSRLPDDAWVVHLDEETQLARSVVQGIHAAIAEEERSGRYRIGQGAILYHRLLPRNGFLTMADSIRTGEDLSRFYLQSRFGMPFFGLHGSFIVVRNSVEKQVGFDFGPVGSTTEDAFWALVQMSKGNRTRWVDGYMLEQAPDSISDFVKQRRRWFVGLWQCVRYAPTRFRYRALLAAGLVLWSYSWLGVLATILNILAGQQPPLWLRVIANLTFSSYLLYYLLGLIVNLQNVPELASYVAGWKGRCRVLGWCVLQLILIPVFQLLEGAGVIYGLLFPDVHGFHVINKPVGRLRGRPALSLVGRRTPSEAVGDY